MPMMRMLINTAFVKEITFNRVKSTRVDRSLNDSLLSFFHLKVDRGDLVMASFELSLIKLNEWFDP
ncbi:hypothetical protein BCU71_01395 [Vibrio lentus]|nr:hypothetical protein BCU71_01395 [Vibrio lentus]PMK71251.1 hypothetical protein BCT93_02255 [Vibrio lentus]